MFQWFWLRQHWNHLGCWVNRLWWSKMVILLKKSEIVGQTLNVFWVRSSICLDQSMNTIHIVLSCSGLLPSRGEDVSLLCCSFQSASERAVCVSTTRNGHRVSTRRTKTCVPIATAWLSVQLRHFPSTRKKNNVHRKLVVLAVWILVVVVAMVRMVTVRSTLHRDQRHQFILALEELQVPHMIFCNFWRFVFCYAFSDHKEHLSRCNELYKPLD